MPRLGIRSPKTVNIRVNETITINRRDPGGQVNMAYPIKITLTAAGNLTVIDRCKQTTVMLGKQRGTNG